MSPKAAGRVLAIDDDQVNAVRSDHVSNVLAHNPPSRAAEYVTNEKNVQKKQLLETRPEIRDRDQKSIAIPIPTRTGVSDPQ